MAVENFRLLEQVLRSQRQWMNTFDSVHDIILAHDADFRIIKANQVIAGAAWQGPGGCHGQNLRIVLTAHTFGEWTGCPYCAIGGDEEFIEGADALFRRLLRGFDFFLYGARQPAKRNDPRRSRHHRPALGGRKISAPV